MKEMLKTIGQATLASVIYYVLEVFFNAAFRLVLQRTAADEYVNLLLAANLMLKLAVLILFGFWYVARENKWHYHPEYRRVFSTKTIFCLLGIGLLGQYAIGFIVALLKYIVPDILFDYETITDILSLDNGSLWITLLLVVVIGPIAEELLFRGVIYGGLRNSFTAVQAAVISAAVFGIYHKNIVQGVYAALFGVILAYIFEKTQTIWGSVLMHMAFNASAYLVKGLGIIRIKTGFYLSGYMYFGICLLCVIIVILCIYALRRMPNRYDEIKKRMEMTGE